MVTHPMTTTSQELQRGREVLDAAEQEQTVIFEKLDQCFSELESFGKALFKLRRETIIRVGYIQDLSGNDGAAFQDRLRRIGALWSFVKRFTDRWAVHKGELTPFEEPPHWK